MSMFKFIQYICVPILLLGTGVQGCSLHRTGYGENGSITGIVRVVGNEPFAKVVVTDADPKAGMVNNWQIIGPLAPELRGKWQMKKVTLEGETCKPTAPEFKKCFQPSKIINLVKG